MGQGYRKFETVQYIRILNLKLSDKTNKMLRHFIKLTQERLKLYGKTIVQLLNRWTVGHRAVQPSDYYNNTAYQLVCLEQHCPTIGQLDKAQSNHLTGKHPAIRQFDSALTNHWTVGHSTVQPLDSLTRKAWGP